MIRYKCKRCTKCNRYDLYDEYICHEIYLSYKDQIPGLKECLMNDELLISPPEDQIKLGYNPIGKISIDGTFVGFASTIRRTTKKIIIIVNNPMTNDNVDLLIMDLEKEVHKIKNGASPNISYITGLLQEIDKLHKPHCPYCNSVNLQNYVPGPDDGQGGGWCKIQCNDCNRTFDGRL